MDEPINGQRTWLLTQGPPGQVIRLENVRDGMTYYQVAFGEHGSRPRIIQSGTFTEDYNEAWRDMRPADLQIKTRAHGSTMVVPRYATTLGLIDITGSGQLSVTTVFGLDVDDTRPEAIKRSYPPNFDPPA